jgi:hypothetical protein
MIVNVSKADGGKNAVRGGWLLLWEDVGMIGARSVFLS